MNTAPPETCGTIGMALVLTPTSDDAATAFADAYGVVVWTGNGHQRRRVYATIAPAERAVKRAHDRGQWAALCLVQLTAVGAP